MFIDDHQSSFMNFGGFLLFQKCTLHIHENYVEVFLINKRRQCSFKEHCRLYRFIDSIRVIL